MAIQVVHQRSQYIILQGDGPTAVLNMDLSQPPFGLYGHTIYSLSATDPTGTYVITNNLTSGSIAGPIGFATNPAIPAGVNVSVLIQITYL